MWSELDWLIPRDSHKIEVDPKYADDLTFIRSDKTKINQIKRTIPKALEEFDLKLNLDKTEEYQITDKNEVEWKDCKHFGSKLDTITDINRRKGLAIDTYKTLEHIFNSSKISNSIKIRTFQTYVTSVFLYNSELWTLTKKLEEEIDIFQRKQLRKILNIYWPQKISNNDLYMRTNIDKWSIVIKKKRLSWLGHLMRLDNETPAKKALLEYIKPGKKKIGRPKTTWVYQIYKELKNDCNINDINFENETTMIKDLDIICKDRIRWKNIMRSIMLNKSTNMQ